MPSKSRLRSRPRPPAFEPYHETFRQAFRPEGRQSAGQEVVGLSARTRSPSQGNDIPGNHRDALSHIARNDHDHHRYGVWTSDGVAPRICHTSYSDNGIAYGAHNGGLPTSPILREQTDREVESDDFSNGIREEEDNDIAAVVDVGDVVPDNDGHRLGHNVNNDLFFRNAAAAPWG